MRDESPGASRAARRSGLPEWKRATSAMVFGATAVLVAVGASVATPTPGPETGYARTPRPGPPAFFRDDPHGISDASGGASSPAAADEPAAEGQAPGGAPAEPAAKQAAADPRPLVLLKVKNQFKPEDKIFGQIVEGRLISDLADMETFRMTGQADAPDYKLTATVRNLVLSTGVSYAAARDADASEQTKQKEMVSVTMDMDLLVQDRQAEEVYAGKLSVGASRELEISLERTNELLTQELIDRAAQKLERTLRKKLPKPKT